MSCIICKNSESKIIFKCLSQCEACGLIYYHETDSSLEIQDIYQEGYFTGEEYLDYKNDKEIIQRNFSSRLKEMRLHIQQGSLFEIGCAYGFFLDLAKKYFSASGIDITEKPTEYARQILSLTVKTGDYLSFPLTEKKQIFCMWDTIEHLQKPEEFLQKIHSEMHSGGYLFLTTGDIGSLLAKARGSKWRMIHPPTHLFYFSKKTITKLLRQYGFEVICITHPGVYRNFKQIIYSLFFLKKNVPKTLEHFLNKFDFPVYLNTFDIMMVTAKKI